MSDDKDRCDLRQMRRVAAMLDRDPETVREGGPLPPGWHFALFTSVDPQSRLREDGYTAANAAGLDELAGQEVMLAGRRTTYAAPVPIGAELVRRTQTLSVTRKQGRSGPLTFVTLGHEIAVRGDPAAIVEEEDFVYREPAPATARPSSTEAVPADHTEPFAPDEATLFRYSALSFNAHRIHYDRRYAVDVAGFPDVVVNGGLIAVTMLDLFARHIGRRPVSTTTQSVRPLFCGRPATLSLAEQEEGWLMTACDDNGSPAMRLTIR